MTVEPRDSSLIDQFVAHYGCASRGVQTVFVPYRICPLGAHIDHQGGPVTALALDRGIRLAFRPNDSERIRLRSCQYPGEVRVDYRTDRLRPVGDWADYLRGAAKAMASCRRVAGSLRGWDGLCSGSWSESGLSSSAAVGVAYLLAIQRASRIEVSATDNIALDQQIENEFLGLRNGMLDPAAVLLARRDQLLRIDCQTRCVEYIDSPESLQSGTTRSIGPPRWSILVAHSGLRENLRATGYNLRVTECRQAARVLLEAADRGGDPPLLNQVSNAEYARFRRLLSKVQRLRAAHFFDERQRVIAGCEAWRQGDLSRFGRLINQSGESSIRQYQCGAPPLIYLFRQLARLPGVYGARFSGAGFRGCCLALVDPSSYPEIARQLGVRFKSAFPELAERFWVCECTSAGGACAGDRVKSSDDG